MGSVLMFEGKINKHREYLYVRTSQLFLCFLMCSMCGLHGLGKIWILFRQSLERNVCITHSIYILARMTLTLKKWQAKVVLYLSITFFTCYMLNFYKYSCKNEIFENNHCTLFSCLYINWLQFKFCLLFKFVTLSFLR